MDRGGSTTTRTTGLPPEIAGIYSGFGNAAAQATQMPYQQYMGPMVADMSGLQQRAMGGFGQLLNGTPSMMGAENMLAQTLAGNGSNPYTSQVENRVVGGVTDAFNRATAGTRSHYNSPGNFNSARHNMALDTNETNLSRGLGDALGALHSSAYESERNRQMQAATMAPQLFGAYGSMLGNAMQAGNVERNFYQQVMDAQRGQWEQANNYPWTQLERGAGVLGRLQGGFPSVETQQGPGADPVSQGLALWLAGSSLWNNSSNGVKG